MRNNKSKQFHQLIGGMTTAHSVDLPCCPGFRSLSLAHRFELPQDGRKFRAVSSILMDTSAPCGGQESRRADSHRTVPRDHWDNKHLSLWPCHPKGRGTDSVLNKAAGSWRKTPHEISGEISRQRTANFSIAEESSYQRGSLKKSQNKEKPVGKNKQGGGGGCLVLQLKTNCHMTVVLWGRWLEGEILEGGEPRVFPQGARGSAVNR